MLHEENTRLAGSTGCNTLIGSYRVDGQQIAFEQVGTTMMACPDTQMRNEQTMLSVLNNRDTWQVDGGSLSLAKVPNGNQWQYLRPCIFISHRLAGKLT